MNDQEMLEDLQQKCLQKQIDELDMLQSIFCNAGELKIADHSVTADINEYLEHKLNIITGKLEYTICFHIQNTLVDVQFELPHLYPLIESPNVSVRSSLCTKSIESTIKLMLNEFIQTLDKSDVYIYEVITWIKDNFNEFLAAANNKSTTADNQLPAKKLDVSMERLWIYSHHIKSKTKRQNIVKHSKELELSGFMLPGKPGIICVEGEKENTQKFWKIIRVWNWHKITIRKSEEKIRSLDNMDTFRRFSGFREELFTDINVDGETVEEVKMNMSIFMKFLELHRCSYMKKELFGFD